MSLVLDTIMEYIDQALAEAPDEEAREDLRDGIIRRLEGMQEASQPEDDDEPAIIITRGQLAAMTGRTLTPEFIEAMDEAWPNSSIPEALATIAASIVDDGAWCFICGQAKDDGPHRDTAHEPHWVSDGPTEGKSDADVLREIGMDDAADILDEELGGKF